MKLDIANNNAHTIVWREIWVLYQLAVFARRKLRNPEAAAPCTDLGKGRRSLTCFKPSANALGDTGSSPAVPESPNPLTSI